jgi:alpha-glucosidase (family GH31 glycosyl hydrolase)
MKKNHLLFYILISVISICIFSPLVLGVPTNISDYSSYSRNGNDVTFTCGSGEVKLSFCTSKMVRVRLSPDKAYRSDTDPDYFMVQKYNWPTVSLTISDAGSYIRVESSDLIVRAQKSSFRLQMYQKDNTTLIVKDSDSQGMYWDGTKRGVYKTEGSGNGGRFGFGGGDHGHSDPFNKVAGYNQFGITHGRVIVPFFMDTAGYGTFLNTVSSATAFDGTGGFYTDQYLDYYFMYGPDFKSILNQYSELTGRMNLLGKWAYGFMLSKYGNDNATQSEFSQWINRLRNEDYPTDVYVFDYGWRGDKYAPHRWDTTRYPDLTTMFNEARSLGFHVGLHNNKGTPEAHDGAFTNPTYANEWWVAHRDNCISPGRGDFFWPDEFDVSGDNLMANRAAKVVHEQWLNLTANQRPMFMTRGGYANHHFAVAWSGDIDNTITEMKYQISNSLLMGLSGYPYFSHDLGGFLAKPTNTLYTRWVAEFGSFCSLMRAHGHNGREPWLYDTTAQTTLRKFLKLRYKLYPYNYTTAWQGAHDGIPMMRAMVLENQNNSACWNMNYQYYWGDWFLVAPALSESATDVSVWLPPGTWYNYFTGQQFAGNQTITAHAELNEMPVFVKAGAIIPMGPAVSYADQFPLDPVTLDIYPADGSSEYTLYEDDGVTRKYLLNDAYCLTKYTCQKTGPDITLTVNARVLPNPSVYSPNSPRSYLLQFNLTPSVNYVKKDGTALSNYTTLAALQAAQQGWYLDSNTHIAYVKFPDSGVQIQISLQTTGALPTPTPTPATTATPTPSPTAGATATPGRNAYSQIEAEGYDSQFGILTQSCSESGSQVGDIDNGDYVVYRGIDFGSTVPSGFDARVASDTSGGNIEVWLDSMTDTLAGTCAVTGTAGAWTTKSCGITGYTGVHDVYLKFTGGSGKLMNLNWFRFTSSAPVRYEAENGTTNATIGSKPEASGGKYVGGMDTVGKYVTVTVNVASAGNYNTSIGYANGKTATAYRSLYLNGVDTMDLDFPVTGAWNTFVKRSPVVLSLISGNNTIKIQTDTGDAQTIDVDYIEIVAAGGSTPTPTSTPASTATPTPTPTATVTPTSTPSPTPGTVLFSDNFEDGDTVGWTAVNGTWAVATDGTKVYRQTTNTVAAKSYAGSAWTNYAVSARIKAVSFLGSPAGVGLYARYLDVNNAYSFQYYTSGNIIKIQKVVGGTWTTLVSKAYTFSTGTWYTFKAVVNGSTLQFWVNGVKELETMDTAFTSGKICLDAHRADTCFDDVMVTP